MKKLWELIVSMFTGKKKSPVVVPPVIVEPKPEEKPVDIPIPEEKPVDIPLPPNQIWNDRRPIGMVMLANFVEYTATDNYMNGETAFDQWIVEHAKSCIEIMKEINSQGLIVWDPAGSTFPRPYTFYGDPRMATAKVDPFFTEILKAGFRTGACLRPDEVRWETDEYWGNVEAPQHYVVESAVKNLIPKIDHARNKWKASLFYVDTNKGSELKPGTKNTIGSGNLMPASIFDELHKLYPDCLFIPEHSDDEYFKSTIPYYADSSVPGFENPPTKGQYVMNCADTTWTQEQLNKSVKEGHILMGRVWYRTPEIPLIKAAYTNYLNYGSSSLGGYGRGNMGPMEFKTKDAEWINI